MQGISYISILCSVETICHHGRSQNCVFGLTWRHLLDTGQGTNLRKCAFHQTTMLPSAMGMMPPHAHTTPQQGCPMGTTAQNPHHSSRSSSPGHPDHPEPLPHHSHQAWRRKTRMGRCQPEHMGSPPMGSLAARPPLCYWLVEVGGASSPQQKQMRLHPTFHPNQEVAAEWSRGDLM